MATTNDWLIFKSKISRPDFYLPQYNLFIEYWGLVDSPDTGTRDNYIRTMRWKMAQYRKNNIRFISRYPSNLKDLDYYFRRKFMEVMGFNLPINQVATTCPKCHQQILDMPLHQNSSGNPNSIPALVLSESLKKLLVSNQQAPMQLGLAQWSTTFQLG